MDVALDLPGFISTKSATAKEKGRSEERP